MNRPPDKPPPSQALEDELAALESQLEDADEKRRLTGPKDDFQHSDNNKKEQAAAKSRDADISPRDKQQ